MSGTSKWVDEARDFSERAYEKWRELPLPTRVFTVLGAAGMATGAASATTALLAFMVNPRWTKRFAADVAYSGLGMMEGGASKVGPRIPKVEKGGFKAQGSLSSTGPGLLVGHSKFPLRLKGDVGGGGVMWAYKPETVSNALKRLRVLPRRHESFAKKYLPPEMYFGLELSPYPFASGAVVDRDNIEETVRRIRKIRRKLRPYTRTGNYRGWDDGSTREK